jgi:hypothetical protein
MSTDFSEDYVAFIKIEGGDKFFLNFR